MLSVEECEPEAYCTTKSGVKFIDTEVGSGEEATAGRVATIEFEGTLLDGVKVLSSTRKDGKPLSFTVEAGDAPLWDEVVAGMRVGGKRRALVPPSNTLPRWDPLPNGATGRFEIELTGLDVEGALDGTPDKKFGRRDISTILLAASFIPYLLPDELKPFGWRGKDPDETVEFSDDVLAPLSVAQQREQRREERALISDETTKELYGRR